MNEKDYRNSNFRDSIRYDINSTRTNANDQHIRYTAKKNTHNKHRVSNKTRRRISALIAAGLIVLGAYGCKKSVREPGIKTDNDTGAITVVNEDKYDRLTSDKAILNDFKERYIKEYNEKNKTRYTSDQIKIYSTSQNYLYETSDGQYVTHGRYPEQTEKIIKQYDGTCKGGDGGELIQIVLEENDSEKVIDACLQGYSNRVLSGNEINTLLNDLKANKGNEKSLLASKNLSEPLKYCIQAQAGYSDKDVDYCINKYKETVKGIDQRENDGFVIE